MRKFKPETFAKVKGAVGVRSIGSGNPPTVFQRDYAYALPMIFKNATILTELSLEDLEEKSTWCKQEAMEALDTISQFYIRMYAECRQNNITGLAGWKEIIQYLGESEEKENDIRQKVFGLFNSFITLSLFVYMFASKEMAVASPNSIDESCYNLETFLSLLSIMEDDKRKKMLSEIKLFGIINPQVNLTALYKQGISYLDDIKKDQEQRYGKSEEDSAVT